MLKVDKNRGKVYHNQRFLVCCWLSFLLQEASYFQGTPVFLLSKKNNFSKFPFDPEYGKRRPIGQDLESCTVSTYGYGLVNIGNLALFTAPRIRVTYPYTEIETMYLNISGLWMC